jgi:hypothetical protein
LQFPPSALRVDRFLAVTAAIEAGAGLGLVALPDVVVKLLLGADIAGAAFPSDASLGSLCSLSAWLLGFRARTRRTR